jgi:hypothetical protein
MSSEVVLPDDAIEVQAEAASDGTGTSERCTYIPKPFTTSIALTNTKYHSQRPRLRRHLPIQ